MKRKVKKRKGIIEFQRLSFYQISWVKQISQIFVKQGNAPSVESRSVCASVLSSAFSLAIRSIFPALAGCYS
eukprot:gene8614-6046_t